MLQTFNSSGPLTCEQVYKINTFMAKEQKIVEKKSQNEISHIRKLNFFHSQIKESILQTSVDDAISLEQWLSEQNEINYWDIFSQLLLGVHQIHLLGLVGRCIEFERIRVQDGKFIFKHFGYYNKLSRAPENLYRKFSTFETDIWLIGAIMWRVLTGKKIYQNKPNFNAEIDLTFNLNTNDSNLDQQLYQLLQQMLQIYQNQRITFTQIFQYSEIKLPAEQSKIEILNFYDNFQLKFLLSQRKNSLLMADLENNSHQPYFYHLENTSILKYFYQLYVEIQLLNLAYHISFYFPNADSYIQKQLNGLILQKMIIQSKTLMKSINQQILPFQFKGQEELLSEDRNYSKLQKDIQEQQNLLEQMNSQIQQYCQSLSIREIQNKFDNYSTDGHQTLMSDLLINILKNSVVNEKSNMFVQSMSLEEIFEYEVQDRII